MSELLTAEQVADRLGIRPATVRRWARAGIIPVVAPTAKIRRYIWASVVEALKRHTGGSAKGEARPGGCSTRRGA